MASSDRPLTPRRLGGCLTFSYVDCSDRSPVSQGGGLWTVSLDLQDAYLQVPVHPSSRRYLRFCMGDLVYQFRALCFGLSMAPQAFTRVMAPVSSIMHRHGFHILRYLDDWLVLGSTFQEIVRARDFLLWLCLHLGIVINLSKSSLDLSQTRDYLGMTISTSPLRVFLTLKRVQKLSVPPGVSLRPPPSSVYVASSPGRHVLHVSHSPSCSSPYAVASASPQCCRSSRSREGSRLLGRWLPTGSSVVLRRIPSSGRSSTWRGPPQPLPLLRRLGHGLGGCSRQPASLACGLPCVRHFPSATRNCLRFFMRYRAFSLLFGVVSSLCIRTTPPP